MRRFLRSPIVLIAAGLLAAYAGSTLHGPAPGNETSGKASSFPPAPAALYSTPLPDPTGRLHKISNWRDRVLVINFWATWCPPCRAEMPGFARLQEKYGNAVQFIGIAIDQADKVAVFSKDNPVPYPLLVGGNAGFDLAREMGNASGGLPYTVVIDGQGKIRNTHLGLLQEEILEEMLATLAETRKTDKKDTGS